MSASGMEQEMTKLELKTCLLNERSEKVGMWLSISICAQCEIRSAPLFSFLSGRGGIIIYLRQRSGDGCAKASDINCARTRRRGHACTRANIDGDKLACQATFFRAKTDEAALFRQRHVNSHAYSQAISRTTFVSIATAIQ